MPRGGHNKGQISKKKKESKKTKVIGRPKKVKITKNCAHKTNRCSCAHAPWCLCATCTYNRVGGPVTRARGITTLAHVGMGDEELQKKAKEVEKKLGGEQLVTSSEEQDAAEFSAYYEVYKAISEFSEMKDIESDGKGLLSKHARN